MVATLFFVLAGCAVRTPPVVPEPPQWTAEPNAELVWLGDGHRIRVGGQVYDRATQRWLSLPAGWTRAQVSPNGARAVHVVSNDGLPIPDATVEIRTLGEDATTSIQVPHFLDLEKVGADIEKAELFATMSAYWLDDAHLLLVDATYMAYQECRVLRLMDQTLIEPEAGCPESDFAEFYAFDRGPDHQLAVYSSGEGHPGVNVVRWTPKAQTAVPLPPMDLYPFGPLRVVFGAEPGPIWLQTPCDLRVERGCMAVNERDEPSPEFVFRWEPGQAEAWQVVHEGVVPGAVFDAVSQQFAWVANGELCVGKGFGAEAACVAVPVD